MNHKVAVVTGGSRGIGREICLLLARLGATVVPAARDMERLEALVREIKAAGGSAEAIRLDLEQEESIRTLVDEIRTRFGRLDILINNAGLTHSALLEETATQDWDRVMRINARGPFLLCREALALLRKSDQATIVNISSVVGVKGYPKQSAYTASKHALRGMSISLAEELRDTGIRVHVICMGGVDTEMVSRVRPDINKDELISPAEIAEIVAWTCTHKGNAVIDEFRLRRAASAPWF